MKQPIAFILSLASIALPALAAAAPPLGTMRSAVYVLCENRRGTGAYVNADEGYVLTNGHVAIDPSSGKAAETCTVGFVDDSLSPKTYHRATVEHAVFDQRRDLDAAVLRIGERISGPSISAGSFRTWEFAGVGDALSIIGFPGSSTTLTVTEGTITSFARGFLNTDAAISKGVSGSPVVDAENRLIGLATRIISEIDLETGQETVVSYEIQDILAIEQWLDTRGARLHDAVVTHADEARAHAAPYLSRVEGLGCTDLARTADSSTVYCLRPGAVRYVFPNAATYASWYPDFSEVKVTTVTDLAKFRLIGNVTMKAGSLVKIQTDPKVYVAVDSIGTLRWVPTESLASATFGADWAKTVRDVPDSFFTDYVMSGPLEE